MRVFTLVMCVVVVVHKDSEVMVWAVIRTPGSPSPLPSNWGSHTHTHTHTHTQRHTHTSRPVKDLGDRGGPVHLFPERPLQGGGKRSRGFWEIQGRVTPLPHPPPSNPPA